VAGRVGRSGHRPGPKRGANRSTTKRIPFRRQWGVVVSILVLAAVGGAGWYLHQSSHLSQSPTVTPSEVSQPKPEPAPVVEAKWLPEGWEQKKDEEKIEFLKKDELAQAEALAAQFGRSDDALVMLGNVYRKYGNSVQALACWEKALAINPARVDAYDGMAMVAMEKGEHERAAQLWGKGISTKPDTREVRNSMAQALSRADRHEEAIGALEEEIRRFPTSGLAYYLLGQESLLKKDYPAAKASYEKAIALLPNHTGSYYGLMTVCLRLKLADEAGRYKSRFDELKARDTIETRDSLRGRNDFRGMWETTAETYLAAESLYRKAGDPRRAEWAMRRAEAIDPDNPKLLTRRAHDLRGQGRPAEALAVHEKLAATNPDDILNLFNMAGICIEIKQYDKAQAALQSAITRAPGFDGAYRELARLYLNLGRENAAAHELAAEAVKLAPTAANYFVYSWACDKNGDHKGAVAALKRSSELEPENPTYREKFRLATLQD
jgi:tetratricopeptide (TPR) repeat protein